MCLRARVAYYLDRGGGEGAGEKGRPTVPTQQCCITPSSNTQKKSKDSMWDWVTFVMVDAQPACGFVLTRGDQLGRGGKV